MPNSNWEEKCPRCEGEARVPICGECSGTGKAEDPMQIVHAVDMYFTNDSWSIGPHDVKQLIAAAKELGRQRDELKKTLASLEGGRRVEV